MFTLKLKGESQSNWFPFDYPHKKFLQNNLKTGMRCRKFEQNYRILYKKKLFF
ncbi:hypothetical protein SAMN02787073_2719 [Chryseobacterium vrystaatense]|uniref:FERM domain-containing protein n=1 Tax=Chryseobacterium vrystaatense TaxID=307480 RepID=A0A1M5DUK3_9FLAO|nr:hypothetical protein SAMN02787073_2719 [Chryseobacterium vrystaatense]